MKRSPSTFSDIKIRRANMTDIPQLVGLLDILFSIEEDFSPNPFAQRIGLELLLKDEKERYVAVAEHHGKVVGMVTVQLRISTASGGYAARVEDVVVSPGYRRQRLGTLLLHDATRWAYSKKAVRLELLVDKDNIPALSFYGKNGWQGTNLILLQK